MKIIIRIFFLVFILFTACEKSVIIDIPDSNPKITFYGLAGGNDSLKLFVSNSFPMLEYVSDSIQSICLDANIELFVNNNYIETLIKLNTEYISTYLPHPGDTVRIITNAQSGEIVTAETYIPFPVVLDSIKIQDSSYLTAYGELYSTLEISFNDPSNQKNFYELYFGIKCSEDKEEYQIKNGYLSDNPVILGEDILEYNPNTIVFSDNLINGEHVNIPLYVDLYCVNDSTGADIPYYSLKVCFNSISEEYYNYRKSLYKYRYSQSGDIFEADTEPMDIYTNVNGGFGIFAGFSSTDYILQPNNQ